MIIHAVSAALIVAGCTACCAKADVADRNVVAANVADATQNAAAPNAARSQNALI